MRISVGNRARVVGTKRVSPRGTIAGLQELAGKDVLIVMPSKAPQYQKSARELAREARLRARKAGLGALREYRAFHERHLRSSVPGADRILAVAPRAARPSIRKADAWVRASALRLEKQARAWLQN